MAASRNSVCAWRTAFPLRRKPNPQIEVAFATGDIWESKAWRGAIKFLKAGNDATSTSSNKTGGDTNISIREFLAELFKSFNIFRLGLGGNVSTSSSAEVAGRVKPIGRIMNGDAVIYYDFRADRAVEIAEAFTAARFDKFDRTSIERL